MTKLNIQIYQEETIKTLVLIENEIKKTRKIIELNSENHLNQKFDEIQITENELADFLLQARLAELYTIQLDTEISLIQEFLRTFPHRRENMSLKYISKQLGISMDMLINWAKMESLNITRNKHGIYVRCREFMDLLRRLSMKDTSN
jgi:hypothetical protein